MKTLVFLLLLGNLLFYAFAEGYFGKGEGPDAARVGQQLYPERMHIVSRGDAPEEKHASSRNGTSPKPVEPKPVAAVPEAPDAPVAAAPMPVCLAWSHLNAADADRLSGILKERFAQYSVSRQVVPAEGNGWWVFIPPQAGKSEAEKKAGELRQLGVNDYFIVQEGVSRYAISLGVFSSEKGAQERLTELKAKGVRSAKITQRPGKDDTIAVKATGPAAARAELEAALSQSLPKLSAADCK